MFIKLIWTINNVAEIYNFASSYNAPLAKILIVVHSTSLEGAFFDRFLGLARPDKNYKLHEKFPIFYLYQVFCFIA